VTDVYVQGTPVCDSGATWGTFSWSFETSPYEVNIDHARYQTTSDHCTAYYCVDVTSAPAGAAAPVSWYWAGDEYGSTPHHPCSDDGYTPPGQSTCDEAVNPQALVPIGAIDVPWFWEDPLSGVVPSLDVFNADIMFTALYTDMTPMPLGDYTATLIVANNTAEGAVNVPVTMHIIDQAISPTASFDHNAPVCDGTAVEFTNTSDPGAPPATEVTWDFGDGVTETVAMPGHTSHLYAGPGTYTVTLEICNDAGCDMAVGTVEVLTGPMAGFSWSSVTLTVTFVNESMNADTYMWDFGDGGTSTETNPMHTYAAAGAYTVTLTAYGDCGMDTYVAVVEVSLMPVAGFEHNAPVCLPDPVVFTNTSTGADTYLWDFGDGSTSTETNPMHAYVDFGTYTVTLEACSAMTCSMAMDWVEVWAQPLAAFTYTLNGLEVTFTNLSEGADAYLWDFGDGVGTSTETNPVYTYAAFGTYTVTLDITGPCGDDTVEMVITVEEMAHYVFLPLVVKPATP
jgi:PKD repeat protein